MSSHSQGPCAWVFMCSHYSNGHRCHSLTCSLSIHHPDLRQTNLTPHWQSHTNVTSIPGIFWHQQQQLLEPCQAWGCFLPGTGNQGISHRKGKAVVREQGSTFAELWDHFATTGHSWHVQCALEGSDGLAGSKADLPP